MIFALTNALNESCSEKQTQRGLSPGHNLTLLFNSFHPNLALVLLLASCVRLKMTRGNYLPALQEFSFPSCGLSNAICYLLGFSGR